MTKCYSTHLLFSFFHPNFFGLHIAILILGIELKSILRSNNNLRVSKTMVPTNLFQIIHSYDYLYNQCLTISIPYFSIIRSILTFINFKLLNL
jgi:hypothetical protein